MGLPAQAAQHAGGSRLTSGWLSDAARNIELRAGAEVFAAWRDLASGNSELHLGGERVHAASTVKLPILLTLLALADEGAIRLDQELRIGKRFRALSGGEFDLDPARDDDPEPWKRLGRPASLAWLAERMIVRSSNLAANLLLERLGPPAVTSFCRTVGARDTQVLRCFDDDQAFAAGINNVTTAADLCAMFAAIGEGRTPNAPSALRLLERRELRSAIPRGVPAGVRVANKTGSIDRHFHDAGLVFPEGRAPYALAILTRSFPSQDDAEAAVAALSAEAWKRHNAD